MAREVLAYRGPSAKQPFHPLGLSKVPPRLQSEWNLLTHNRRSRVSPFAFSNYPLVPLLKWIDMLENLEL